MYHSEIMLSTYMLLGYITNVATYSYEPEKETYAYTLLLCPRINLDVHQLIGIRQTESWQYFRPRIEIWRLLN